MYRYETHLHTSPTSACAVSSVEESVRAYKDMGYDGVFITNHFLDGNCSDEIKSLPYREGLALYYAAYLEAREIGEKLGIKVFFGVELAYRGTDFLVYGLDYDWYLAHPEIMDMKKSDELMLMASEGALIIQAHPFREAKYIDHIRLFPRRVHGVEVVNGCRTEFENAMAKQYADSYELIHFGGTDNHRGPDHSHFAGVEFCEPITCERDFVEKVKSGAAVVFEFTKQ